MADDNDQPHGEMQAWSVASFGDYDNWYYVEGDKADERYGLVSEPTDDQLADVLDLVVHIVDADGVDHYYTLHGPWEDYTELSDQIADLYEKYGGEAA